jgi:hypothetical protein
MFARCLSCHRSFEENESLERLRTGRRVAYDPERGRLWTLCSACRAWNLAPIEERWEALEELERLTRDRGRLLASTDHVGLIEAEDLEVVRVGRAKLPEEAWWRYGSELLRRRRRQTVNQALEVAATVGLAVATGGAAVAFVGGSGGVLSELQRWRKFGRVAWRGEARCGGCDRPLRRIRFAGSKRLRIDAAMPEGLALVYPCKYCRMAGGGRAGAAHRIEGVSAEHVLRRVMAHRNFGGGKEKHIRQATELIDSVGSPRALIREFGQGDLNLREVGGAKKRLFRSLALEIALNDDSERRLLQLELGAIEARWREEEEIAAIIDGELTPLPAGVRIPAPSSAG